MLHMMSCVITWFADLSEHWCMKIYGGIYRDVVFKDYKIQVFCEGSATSWNLGHRCWNLNWNPRSEILSNTFPYIKYGKFIKIEWDPQEILWNLIEILKSIIRSWNLYEILKSMRSWILYELLKPIEILKSQWNLEILKSWTPFCSVADPSVFCGDFKEPVHAKL